MREEATEAEAAPDLLVKEEHESVVQEAVAPEEVMKEAAMTEEVTEAVTAIESPVKE